METRARRFTGIIGALIIGLGLPALGQGIPVTVTVTSVSGSPTVTVGGETVAAGVYDGTTSLPGATPGLICDDFAGQVTPPATWNALAYQVSTLTPTIIATDLLFGGAHTPPFANIGVHGYAALADLVNLSFNSAGNPTLQADISEAIWSITSPGLSGVDAAAQTLAANALAYATSTSDSFSQYSNLWIYVPTSDLATTQEMWGRVPEGGSALMYLLLGGLFCFGAVFLNFRNRFGTLKA